ncbi:hypothetical protein POM88_012751 [Heracleum sosnowskyi]|uniref:MULE transposase domain-containing protein n=1 Tax=Heracleum sosnowskyi TaxID=360622 RepID=A0AAD8IXB3_9APIA|nr:hypothetical protein POM88_012751 [Heracleum sosnowskyi]
MDNIPVIVQHNGHWDESLRYLNFEVFGLLMPKNCNYTNLLMMLISKLQIQKECHPIFPTTTIMKIASGRCVHPGTGRQISLLFEDCIRFKDKHQATTNVTTDIIKHKFTNIKTRYSVADIIRDMKHDHNVEVKYNKAWRYEEKALEIMKGNAIESFVELYTYLYMVYTTNVGSIVELQLTGNNCFLYVFVALNSSMKEWNHCLPVVVVDGTFLKSSYGGTLLVAATHDAWGNYSH